MKRTKLLLASAALGISFSSFAQVKIGDNPTTINAGSVLELESTNKGLLMPRVSLTSTTTWLPLLGASAGVEGMHVYNTNVGITSSVGKYPVLAAGKGEYYWDGAGWVALASAKAVFVSATGANQTVTVGTASTLTFANEILDPTNSFAASVFTAPSDGIYLLTVYVRVSALTGGPYPRMGFPVFTNVSGTLTQIAGGIADLNEFGYGSAATQLQLTAGQTVNLQVNPTGAAGSSRTFDIKRMEITKITD